MTGWGFIWHPIETLAQRQAPCLQNSSLNTNPSLSPSNLCICYYLSSNFHHKWKSHLLATANPKHFEDREERSVKGYYVPTELKPAFYSSCIESSGPGHAGHMFPQKKLYEITWEWEEADSEPGSCLTLTWAIERSGSSGEAPEASRTWVTSYKASLQVGNQVKGTRMDSEGALYICRWRVKGVAGGACEVLKKGSEDSAGGKGLATALGMDEEILCILLFYFYLHISVSKGRLGHPGRNSAAVTGTMICFLLPFSVQFPRWMSKRGLWEAYCNGKSWWAASRSWFSLCCPHLWGWSTGWGGSVLLATGRPRTSLPVGLWIDVSCCCPPLIMVPLGLMDGFPEDRFQGQFEVHHLLLPGALASWFGQTDGAEVWEHPRGHPD